MQTTKKLNQRPDLCVGVEFFTKTRFISVRCVEVFWMRLTLIRQEYEQNK